MSSPDVELWTWNPHSDSDVLFLLEMEIGDKAADGADLFYVVIATPEGLRSDSPRSVLVERATLVFSEFSWDIVKTTLQNILTRCSGDSWNAAVVRLQRYFQWEYEDYRMD